MERLHVLDSLSSTSFDKLIKFSDSKIERFPT